MHRYDYLLSTRCNSLKYTTTETGVVTEEPGLTLCSDVSDHFYLYSLLSKPRGVQCVLDATSLQGIKPLSGDCTTVFRLVYLSTKTTSQVNIYDISGKLVKTQNVDNAIEYSFTGRFSKWTLCYSSF